MWRDVRVLDADDIEQALEVSPAVQIWLSELLGMDPFGATSIEDWWERFSRGFRPKLTSPVVLAGREDQAAALARRLADEVGRTFIRAASIDDGLAFAACSMMVMGPDNSEPMLAKSLLIHDGATLRRLERTSSLLILLPYEEHLQRDAHLIDNHHFAVLGLPYGRGADFPFVNEAARQLIAHGRPAMALDALSMYAARQSGVDTDLIIEALKTFGTKEDPEAARVSDYDISRLLEYLKEQGVEEETIALLEWRYLPLLHDESRTLALERLLARSPANFVELVTLVFRRKNEEADSEPRNDNATLASNAYRLLREWKIVPGTRADGTVDVVALGEWLEEARRLLADADRTEIGELQIGEVLAHAPEDPDGTFPTLSVRDVLEAAPSNHLQRGFSIGLFNKRGITSRGLTDGGEQEYNLAAKYEWWASAVQATHPRTASALRDLAESYRQEGRRNYEEVRRYLEGLDL